MNFIEVDMGNVSVKASVTRESTENPSSNQDTDAVSSSSEGQITMDEFDQVQSRIDRAYELEGGRAVEIADEAQSPVIANFGIIAQEDAFRLSIPDEVEEQRATRINTPVPPFIRSQFENAELPQRTNWKFPSCSSILENLGVASLVIGILICLICLILSWYDFSTMKLGICQGRTTFAEEFLLIFLLVVETVLVACGLILLISACCVSFFIGNDTMQRICTYAGVWAGFGFILFGSISFLLFLISMVFQWCNESVVYFVPPVTILAMAVFIKCQRCTLRQREKQEDKISALKLKIARCTLRNATRV